MELAEDLEWLHVYWVNGTTPKHYGFRNAVTDPPCSGWQHAFVMRGEKRSTIFCPYSFRAYSVPSKCAELRLANEAVEYSPEFMETHLNRKWAEFQGFGFQRDYDTCALVMRRLGLEVPAQVMTGGEEDKRKRGGKDTGTRLTRPVKAASKRGKFLRWFMDGGCTRSVREAMAEFSMTRSNALSYLYMIQKDHGIGYSLTGDLATVMLPDGCNNPFDEELQTAMNGHEEPQIGEEEDDNDDWLC